MSGWVPIEKHSQSIEFPCATYRAAAEDDVEGLRAWHQARADTTNTDYGGRTPLRVVGTDLLGSSESRPLCMRVCVCMCASQALEGKCTKAVEFLTKVKYL